MINFKNKKVLLFGLGLLGGGIASAKWLFKEGAKLRITDLKTKEQLRNSLNKLKKIKVTYILGKHRYQDFDWAEIIVVNPAISYKNEFLKYSLEKDKIIENDCSLFFQINQDEVIAVTGTRGKTTTTYFIYQLLKIFQDKLKKKIVLGGNQPDKSLLKIVNKRKGNKIFVLELSSFQLEFYHQGLKSPKIAIITNIFNDHLNRYSTFEEYASIKAKIFQNQTKDDFLILNYNNKFTKFFLKQKPKSKIYFVSKNKLPNKLNGIYLNKNNLIFRENEKDFFLFNAKDFILNYGEHNLNNLLFAFTAVYLYLKNNLNDLININEFKNLKNFLLNLETPSFRQQFIYRSQDILVVNDSAATSPEATIMALERFSKLTFNKILITGGTDKNLDFKDLAKKIKEKIKSKNLILLEGSGTKKLITELKKINYPFKVENICQNLKKCLEKTIILIKKNKKNLIIFSPGSASFEKFKNEFDRGKKFNNYLLNFIKKL